MAAAEWLVRDIMSVKNGERTEEVLHRLKQSAYGASLNDFVAAAHGTQADQVHLSVRPSVLSLSPLSVSSLCLPICLSASPAVPENSRGGLRMYTSTSAHVHAFMRLEHAYI